MSTNKTFNDMDEAQGHILELIGNLSEDKNKIDDATIRDLKEKVDQLFGETFKDMTTLQHDLKDILISFKTGRLTSDQFERMIMSEAERSGFLVAMAEKLNEKLESLFEMMATIIDAIEGGDEISDTKISSLFLDMGNVMDSVRSISKVIATPSQAVSSSITKVTLDLKKSDEKYNREIEQINIIEKKTMTESKNQESRENNREHIENSKKNHGSEENTDSSIDAGIRKPRLLQQGSPGRMSIRALKSPTRELEEDTISLASNFRVNVRLEAGCQTLHSGPIEQNERGERARTLTPNKSKRKNEDNSYTHTHTHTHTNTKTTSSNEDDSPERRHMEVVDPTQFNNLKINGAPAALVFPKSTKDSSRTSPSRKGSALGTQQVVEQITKAAELKAVFDSTFLEQEMKRIKAIEESILVKEASLEEREKAMTKKLKKMEKELQKKEKEIQRLNSYTKSPKGSIRKTLNDEIDKASPEKPSVDADISGKAILENYEVELSTPIKSLSVLGNSYKKDKSPKNEAFVDDFINLSAPNTPGVPLIEDLSKNEFYAIASDGLQFQVPALNLIPEDQIGRPQLKGSSVQEPLTPDSLSVSTILGSYHAPFNLNAPPRNNDLILIYPPSTKDQVTNTDDIDEVLGPLPVKPKVDDFNDDIFDDPSRPTTGQLPLVSQVGTGLLAVRTYRNIPPRNFKGDLKESKNPLLLLHNEYYDELSNAFRARLMNAAVDDKSTKSLEFAKSMFASIIPTLEKIDNACAVCVLEGESCDQIIDTLILWLEQKDYSIEKYNDALMSLYKKTGEIESMKLWTDVQLVEYRSIFEKFNASNIYCLPVLLQKCNEFQISYKLFLSCQGKSLDMMKRIEVIKARVAKYKLSKARSVNMMIQDKSQISNSNGNFRIEEIIRLEAIVSKLQEELAFVEADRDELNLEVFRVMQEGDKTPGAFLFFAGLHDQSTIKVFQQLALQLNQIKGFAECNTYMDFATLRKRLLVCISTIPTVEKFIDKYASLYKKWTQRRLEAFTDRGMIGGVADEGHVCPMCNCDNREQHSLQVPKFSSLKKPKEDPKKVLEERRLKARIAELVYEERARSAGTTLPGIQTSKSTNDLQVPRRSIVIKTPVASAQSAL
jgi:hypothetical protein